MRFIAISLLITAPLMAQLPVTNGGTGVSGPYLPYPQSITMNALSTPTAPSGTPNTSCGTIGAVTYYGEISAFDASGIYLTNASVVSSAVTTSGSGNCIAWSWSAVTGASAYRLFVSNSALFSTCRYFSPGSATSFNQTVVFTSGTTCPGGKPPTSNSTGEVHNLASNILTVNQTGASDGTVVFNAFSTDQTGVQFGSGNWALSTSSGQPISLLDQPVGAGFGLNISTSNSSANVVIGNTGNSTQATFDPNDNLCLGTYSAGCTPAGTVTSTVDITGQIRQNGAGNFAGDCTMSSGACLAQTFGTAFSTAPACTCSWDGTGTLTGLIKCIRNGSTITPTSTVNTDTAHIGWICIGNPN